jgi:hypothetical protein
MPGRAAGRRAPDGVTLNPKSIVTAESQDFPHLQPHPGCDGGVVIFD